MASPNIPGCVDTFHDFVYLRQVNREVSSRRWERKDVFYCRKCIHQVEIETKVPASDASTLTLEAQGYGRSW
jgi:hypothetical protein